MTAPDAGRIKEIFFTICQAPPAERERLLRDLCGADESLRTQVEALLAADSRASDTSRFLETPLFGRLPAPEALNPAHAAATPVQLGQYAFVRKIGEGGMGVVYEAAQQHPRRTVALKLIRPLADSPRLHERFRREADVLGRLQHPGIACIYEAGVAEVLYADDSRHQQPFFAMELIHGRPLDQFAREQHLDRRARLKLLARVCDAVHHAHQRGVIHRDLKPSNILVDAAGQPKILDFGVARITDADVQHLTLQTEVGRIVGTVQYMSPEQVAGDHAAIDTRSDVYALGVIAYELLTGRLPYEINDRLLHEASRIIREQDPAPLGSLGTHYRGDIETIIATALEKEKDRRYPSADAFAADIRRHLADQPILARPASATYRVRKFARRHKALVASAAVVFVALLLGLAGTSWGLVRANRQRNVALAALDQAQQVEDFYAELIQAARPDREGRETTVSDLLAIAATRISDRFAEHPATRAVLHNAIGHAYMGLQRPADAETHLRQGLELAEDALGPQIKTVAMLHNLAEVYMMQQRFADAEPLLDRALLMAPSLGDEKLLGSVMNMQAALYSKTGRDAEAEALFARTLDIQRRTLGDDNEFTLATMFNLARANVRLQRYDQAEVHFRNALAGLERLEGSDGHRVLMVRSNLAEIAIRQDRFADAQAHMVAVVDGYRRGLGPDADPTVRAEANLVFVYQRLRQFDLAHELLHADVERTRRLHGPDDPRHLAAQTALADSLLQSGRPGDAAQLLADLLAPLRATQPPATGPLAEALLLHGRCLAELDRYEESESAFVEALQLFAESSNDKRRTDTRTRLVALYEKWNRPEKAAEWTAAASPDHAP